VAVIVIKKRLQQAWASMNNKPALSAGEAGLVKIRPWAKSVIVFR